MSRTDYKENFLLVLKERQPEIFKKCVIHEVNKTKVLLSTKYGMCDLVKGSLLSGSMPCILSAVDKNAYFINKAKEVHGNKYDYSLVNYINNKKRVKIICPFHGEFLQTPIHHIATTKGCITCNKENPNCYSDKSWDFRGTISPIFHMYKCYIIKCWNEEEEFYKIGKTFLKVNKRMNKKVLPYNYEIVEIFYNKDSSKISKLERLLHKKFKTFKYEPNLKFPGFTECCSKINL